MILNKDQLAAKIHEIFIKNSVSDYVPDFNFKKAIEQISAITKVDNKKINDILMKNARNGGDFLPNYKFKIVAELIAELVTESNIKRSKKMDVKSIVQGIVAEAKLTEYQQHVKDELADADPEDFKDRAKLMKDVAKKWHDKKADAKDNQIKQILSRQIPSNAFGNFVRDYLFDNHVIIDNDVMVKKLKKHFPELTKELPL